MTETTGSTGKGRPTPKRRDAERQRRGPVTAPRTRKEANQLARAKAREQRGRARDALRGGDDRYLPARDRGPARALVRDTVDARRNSGNYLLIIAVAVLFLDLIPSPALKSVLLLSYPVFIVWIGLDAVLLSRLIRRRITERLPGENPRGHLGYALLRSFQVRRLRMPPPRVKPGQPV